LLPSAVATVVVVVVLVPLSFSSSSAASTLFGLAFLFSAGEHSSTTALNERPSLSPPSPAVATGRTPRHSRRPISPPVAPASSYDIVGAKVGTAMDRVDA